MKTMTGKVKFYNVYGFTHIIIMIKDRSMNLGRRVEQPDYIVFTTGGLINFENSSVKWWILRESEIHFEVLS